MYSRLITDTAGLLVRPLWWLMRILRKDVFLNGSLMEMPPKIRRFILFDEKKESDCITKIKYLLISEIKDLFCVFFFSS